MQQLVVLVGGAALGVPVYILVTIVVTFALGVAELGRVERPRDAARAARRARTRRHRRATAGAEQLVMSAGIRSRRPPGPGGSGLACTADYPVGSPTRFPTVPVDERHAVSPMRQVLRDVRTDGRQLVIVTLLALVTAALAVIPLWRLTRPTSDADIIPHAMLAVEFMANGHVFTYSLWYPLIWLFTGGGNPELFRIMSVILGSRFSSCSRRSWRTSSHKNFVRNRGRPLPSHSP